MSAHVDSPLGRVSSTWTREHGRFTLRNGYTVFRVGSGDHVFRSAL